MGKNRYSVVAHYTRDLVYERIAPGLLQELETRSPKDNSGHRKSKLHQWLTEDIGDPMLAQNLHSLIMMQRLAIANGYGWNRFVKSVDQVMPKKGETLELQLRVFKTLCQLVFTKRCVPPVFPQNVWRVATVSGSNFARGASSAQRLSVYPHRAV